MSLGNQNLSVATNKVTGTFNLNGGANLYAGSIDKGTGTGTGAATRTFNWNDGTIHNYDASTDLTINDLGSTGATSTFALLGAGAHTFNIDASRQGTVAQIISNAGGLTKAGLGVLALSGANTYAGGTMVMAGTLQAGNAGALGTGVVNIGDASPSGSGKLQGTVAAVNIGGDLNLYSGTLDIRDVGAGQFTLASNKSFLMNTGTTWNLNLTDTATYDRILGSGGSSIFDIEGGTLDLTGSTLAAGNYTILSGFGFGTGNFSAITGYDMSAYTVSFDDNTTPGAGILTVMAVPEANTWAMMLGGFGTLIVFQRGRRRKMVRVS